MSIVVFWIQASPSDFLPGFSEPRCRTFQMAEMTEAIQFMNEKRKEDRVSHVNMSVENPDMVGKKGVDSIVDGKTPDGQPYTWMKRRSQ